MIVYEGPLKRIFCTQRIETTKNSVAIFNKRRPMASSHESSRTMVELQPACNRRVRNAALLDSEGLNGLIDLLYNIKKGHQKSFFRAE